MRISRRGEMEIVYDNGPAARIIWRVLGSAEGQALAPDHRQIEEEGLSDAMRIAVAAARVVPTLHLELKKRAIVLETLQG
jgi:hypothetical protein